MERSWSNSIVLVFITYYKSAKDNAASRSWVIVEGKRG